MPASQSWAASGMLDVTACWQSSWAGKQQLGHRHAVHAAASTPPTSRQWLPSPCPSAAKHSSAGCFALRRALACDFTVRKRGSLEGYERESLVLGQHIPQARPGTQLCPRAHRSRWSCCAAWPVHLPAAGCTSPCLGPCMHKLSQSNSQPVRLSVLACWTFRCTCILMLDSVRQSIT